MYCDLTQTQKRKKRKDNCDIFSDGEKVKKKICREAKTPLDPKKKKKKTRAHH
jgi:hypothetical protein